MGADKAKGMARSRARLFLENMLVYGMGSMLGKMVPLLMLPVITRLMPGTEYFGLSDLSNTLVSFAQAFAVMGMYDAMFRMYFEEASLDYKRQVCTTSLYFVSGSSLIVATCLFLLKTPIAAAFFGSVEFTSLVTVSALSVLVGGNSSIVQAPTRMQNKRATFVVMNLLTSVLSYSISIPMILAGQYLLALPIAGVLASLAALAVFYILNRSWFRYGLFDRKLLREMLVIGIPLMPTFLFYWVFNSADRLMILHFLGPEASGIYAVAAKVGNVSQLIYTAFAQGWQYFAFSTMRDDDQVELNSRVYEYLGVVSLLATTALLVVLDPVYRLLFPEQYASGVTAVPCLFLAPLLLMLFQVAGNQLLVVKKTWPLLIMLSLGVISNVVLNCVLIPVLGTEGAALATLAGYVVTNMAALMILSKMGLLKLRKRLYVVTAIFAVIFILWRMVPGWTPLPMVASFGLMILIAIRFYGRDVRALFINRTT